MNISIFDVIGIVGTTVIALVYLLQQLGKLAGDSLPYLYANLGGAVLLLISLMFTFNLASFIMEIFWITASLIGLFRHYRKKSRPLAR